MSHKDYKEGMASQAKADSAAWRNAEWLLKNLSDSDKKWKNRYGEIVDTTINILSEMELKEIYGISKQFDIADMEESERLTLVAVLYYLAKSNSSSTSYIKKSLQRMYISSIARYLKIANFPSFDIEKIKNIDSKKSERVILRCVMEYLFLENFDHSYMETQKTIIEMFSVSAVDISNIQEEIDSYVFAIGPDGLAGRYAYLASEKVKDKKPAELKIKIYYQPKDKHSNGNKSLADNLKKALEGCGNECRIFSISKLDEDTFDRGEYSIMLGDNATTRGYLSTSNTYHEILGDFGCSIKVDSNGRRIIVTNDAEAEISDRDSFIRYFETICTSPYESNNNDNKAKKLANKRKEKQEKKQKSKHQSGDTGLKIMDSTSWLFDFWDRANFGESIGGNILGLLAMIVSGIVYLPVMVSMLIVGGVVGISEAAIGALTEKLADSNFDSKFVGVAQETITYVKTVEYVFNKQLETAE